MNAPPSAPREALTLGPIVNLAAYRFVALGELPARREALRTLCDELQLKGTIQLAPEGINLFVAGGASACDALKAALERDPLTANLDWKVSYSREVPFRRMLVKVKHEIIAFGKPEIDPARRPAPPIEPHELKRWLDEGRDIVLLDTRNAFEVDAGTFEGAQHLRLTHFRDFPRAAQAIAEPLKSRAVVTFCTGGIRCEKAAPYLQQLGVREVYQLHGGILRYFEEVGHAHYRGECFVFDERETLDADLSPRSTVI